MSIRGGDKPSNPAQEDLDFRNKFPYPLIPTNMKGVYTFPAPPDDFDPNKASSPELERYGLFWPRPSPGDNPVLIRAWNEIFSRKWSAKDLIVPNLVPQAGTKRLSHRPSGGATDANYLNAFWSGAILDTGTWSSIIGSWQVPSVFVPPDRDQGNQPLEWFSASWIGIDGFGAASNDVLQIGVEQDVPIIGLPSYYAWYEWYVPGYQGSLDYVSPHARITNFEVGPRDVIHCHVAYVNHNTAGYVRLVNASTGKFFHVVLQPPPGASFNGSSAEWIMECPYVVGQFLPTLPKFSAVTFAHAIALGPNGLGNPRNADTVYVETDTEEVLTSTTTADFSVTILSTPYSQADKGSALTCLFAGDGGPRVYYLDKLVKQEVIHELSATDTGWSNDLTTNRDIPADAWPRVGSALTSLYIGDVGSRVYYQTVNNDIREQSFPGEPPPPLGVWAWPGSALTSLYISDVGSRVYFLGLFGLIGELALDAGVPSARHNLAAAALDSALTCLYIDDVGSRVYFLDSNSQIGELALDGSGPPSIRTGLAQAAPGSALTCLYIAGVGSRIYFLSEQNYVSELALDASNPTPPRYGLAKAAPGSALTCLLAGSAGTRVYYLDPQHSVREVALIGGVSQISNKLAQATPGSALTCLYIDDVGSRVYFLNRENHYVSEVASDGLWLPATML